jgi:hypothetical protein
MAVCDCSALGGLKKLVEGAGMVGCGLSHMI